MKNLGIYLLLSLLVFSLFGQSPRLVARLDHPEPQLIYRFLDLDMDIASYRPGQYLDLVLTQPEYERLRQEFPQLRITQREEEQRANLRSGRDIAGYRSYAQLVNELNQLQTQYPALMSLSSIGTGWGHSYAQQLLPAYLDFDHQIWAVKLSANVQVSEDEPAFYFVGEHHAREPLSTEVCMGIINHLLQNYGTDPQVTGILDSSEIWVVPLLNPDGHRVVISETDTWWRKNIRDNNANQSFDHESMGTGADGVDLNRNYGYYWGYTSATDYQPSATYHGPNAFSEPETQALRDFLQGKRWLAGIGYHTYGEYVLYPYGYVNEIEAPDRAELSALANDIAAVLPGLYGGNYDPGPSWGLYPVSGSLDDWAYASTGAFAYTIEMAQQFIPSASQVAQIVPQQVQGALTLLQRKDRKILRGHITDMMTGQPLVATVTVDGLDGGPIYRTPISSDSLFGAYYYLLPAGSHTVRYQRTGYEAQTLSVNIGTAAPTIQDLALNPTQPYDLMINVIGDFYAPLEGALLSLSGYADTLFVSDGAGRISLSGFYPGTYQMRLNKPGFETLHLSRDISTPDISLRITSQPVFADDFEQDMDDWVRTGNWNRTTADHYGGSYCLSDSPAGNYSNNSNTFCRLASPLDLHNVENANLQFWVRTELALDDDCLLLEYSFNGNNWEMLDFYTGSAYWTLKSLNLNSLIGNDVYLRFRLLTGSYGTGNGVFIDGFKFYGSTNVTSVSEELAPPAGISLSARPNPFSQSSEVRIISSRDLAHARLGVYNLRGQLLRVLADQDLAKGESCFSWDGRDARGDICASGIYLLRISADKGVRATVKLVRID